MRRFVTEELDRQRPHLFLWVPVAIGCGIGTYFSLRMEPVLPVSMVGPLVVLALVLAIRMPGLPLRLVAVGACLFALGLSMASWRAHSVAAPVISGEFFGAVEGRVVHIDRSANNRVRLTLDRLVLYGVEPAATPARVRISLSKAAPTDRAGQRILVYARLAPPGGPVEPGGFDFRRFAWFRGLGGIGYALGPVLPSMTEEQGGAMIAVVRLRMFLSRLLQAQIPGTNGGFAAAILTGDRSGIDPAMLGDLRASNLAHLLAISGLHMGLLTGLFFAGTRLALAAVPRVALRVPAKKVAAVVGLMAGLGYLVLSGASIATQRAFVMAAVVFVAVLLDRPAFTLRGVALAALIILLLRPESLITAGFQMSFAATIGLVAAYDLLRRQTLWQRPTGRVARIARPVLLVAFTSAVAGAATAPFSAFHFNQIAQYGLLANVLAVPLMGTVIMPAAIIAIALSPLGLGGPAFWVAGQGIGLVLKVAGFVAGLEGALILVPSGPPVVLAVVTAGGLALAFLLGRARVVGVPVVVLGLLIWAAADRPDILIDPTARLAGVRTEAGRALTRARGAGYAANTWLENDGDGASQRTAAARPPAEVNGLRLWVVDGGAPVCGPGDILLLTAKAVAPNGPCVIFHPQGLALTGAAAIYGTDGRPAVVTSRDLTGIRLWAN